MKIRTKLIISFCIIIFVPSALLGVVLFGMYHNQTQEMEDNYEVQQEESEALDEALGSLSILPPEEVKGIELRVLGTDLVVSVFFILVITACALIAWIYGSIITPIRKLEAGAEFIKEGNLDVPIECFNQDELGELANTLEEMRLRLKGNAQSKLQDEHENRVLISNIAHDLRTPITAIKGYAEGILDGVANTPEKVDKYVRTIYSKAVAMDTLINELTIYSKIDTNRIPYNFAKIHVQDYFQDCADEIGLEAEERGIGFTYCNYVDEEVIIIADPEQLKRVVNNIVSNSIKYMNKEKGMIHIRIRDVGDFIQVEIEDNGRGIAQKDVPLIFERFFRADESRNSSIGGSGIGLSIVRKIIEDHGGKIWVNSKEGMGTVMHFVIRKWMEGETQDQVIIG